MLIYEIIVTPYYVIYYNITVNIPIYYSNPTIVNIYWHYRKLIYKIIINRGGYKITYFVASLAINRYRWVPDPVKTPLQTPTESHTNAVFRSRKEAPIRGTVATVFLSEHCSNFCFLVQKIVQKLIN
jgi:hypothetical protein